MDAETILVVDDNREIVYSISELLKYEGYQVVKAYDGMEALEALEREKIDLILLDVMMPKMNGLSALMKLRERSKIPVIILSAKTEESDKVSGLVLGADDYVEKPYQPAELTARVKAHLRRYHAWGAEKPETDEDRIVNGGMVLDKKQRLVIVEGEEVRLTATEYKIFELLMEHPGQIFPAEQIYELVWKERAENIALRGISMGGATVMMASGEELPGQVRAIVEDCGYTSAWDEFHYQLKMLYHLPAFPLLYVTDLLARVKAGYGLKAASAKKQVAKCRIPMLFIHGEKDALVPYWMLKPLYEAASCPKECFVVENAGHGEARQAQPEEYWKRVFGFLERNMLTSGLSYSKIYNCDNVLKRRSKAPVKRLKDKNKEKRSVESLRRSRTSVDHVGSGTNKAIK